MPVVSIQLDISADEYLAYYQGLASDVIASAEDGRMVKFPADLLRRYVSHSGVRGRFNIYFDERGKFLSIERVSS